MHLNIINEETHRVNDDINYEVTNLDSHRIITIDNVLKNPQDFISEVVEKLPMEYNTMVFYKMELLILINSKYLVKNELKIL